MGSQVGPQISTRSDLLFWRYCYFCVMRFCLVLWDFANSTSGSNFTFASPSACHSAFAYQISSKSDNTRQTYKVISIFQDGGRQPYWIFSRVTADHPRSANEGLRSVLKFRLDRIYNFGDNAIFVLWGFGSKFPIYTWLYPPRMRRVKG